MSTVLDEPRPQTSTSPTQRLRAAMAAARVSVHWFGVRKSLTQQQTAQAADAFGAEDRFLSAAKKLLDTTHPCFKTVTAVRSRLQNYWKGISLPFPEPGIRLIRSFAAHLNCPALAQVNSPLLGRKKRAFFFPSSAFRN